MGSSVYSPAASRRKRSFLLYDLPLQLFGCIRLAMSPLGGSTGCASALESSSGIREPTLQAFTPYGGLLLGAWGAPNKGNTVGVEGIFGNAGCVWALCHICPVVGWMINNRETLFQKLWQFGHETRGTSQRSSHTEQNKEQKFAYTQGTLFYL